MQDPGVYEVQKDDGTTVFMKFDGKNWVGEVPKPKVQETPVAPHASEIQRAITANSGTILPRFDVNMKNPGISDAFKLQGNAILQVADVIPSSIAGLMDLGGALEDISKSRDATDSPPIDLSQALKQAGEPFVKQYIADRFTQEGFSKNPLNIPMDVASLVSPLIRERGVGDSIKGLAGAIRDSKVKSYLGNTPKETFSIPEFKLTNVTSQGVPSLSTPQDIVATTRQFGMHPPTVGQMSGDARAIRNELLNPKLGDVLQSQNEGISRAMQHFIEQPSLNGTNNQINLAMDTSQATGIIRNQIVKGIKAEQKFLNNSIENSKNEMVKILSSGGQPVDPLEVLQKADTMIELGANPKMFKSLSPDLQKKITDLKSLRKGYDSDVLKLTSLENSSLVRKISRSQNVLDPRAPKPTSVNPDFDYTNLIKEGLKSPEMFQRFVNIPGVGKENAAQLLIYDIANKSRIKGSQFFSPRALYEGFTDKNNASMLKRVLDPKARVGLQNFAYTLQKLDRYTPEQLQNMAFSLGVKKDAATINIGGSVIPKLLGGNIAQMRAGYGFMQHAMLVVKGKYFGRLLVDPNASWLLSSIAQTPKNSPSLGGKVRQLVKIMGELHIPSTFDVNGEEMEFPVEEPIN